MLTFVCLPPDQCTGVLEMEDRMNRKCLNHASSYHTMKPGEIALVKMDDESIVMKSGEELTLK